MISFETKTIALRASAVICRIPKDFAYPELPFADMKASSGVHKGPLCGEVLQCKSHSRRRPQRRVSRYLFLNGFQGNLRLFTGNLDLLPGTK